MKQYLITYYDGGTKTVLAYNVGMALQMVDGQDFIQRIEQISE